MTTPNDFSEYYKIISDTELVSILDNPDDYQPSAVEAAKEEFSKRQLSETEIQEARQPFISKQEQKAKEREKVKAVEIKIKEAGNTFIDTINPIQSGIPSTEKTIRLITIVFGGLSLYQIIKDFRMHLLYIKDIPRFPFESSLYLAPLVFLPVAIFIFWKRISIGWFLLAIFITYSVVVIVWTLILSFLWEPSGNSILDSLVTRPPILTQVIQLIFFGSTLFIICKQNIRSEFSISENKMIATTAITGVLTFFFVYSIS